MEQADIEAVKQQVYDVRERVYAIRTLVRGNSRVEKEVEQALLEAEYFLDRALHEIDPTLVS